MRKMLLILALIGFGATIAVATPFSREDHYTKYVEGGDCTVCHKPGDTSIVPNLVVCNECHDAKHTEETTFPSLKTHGPLWSLDHGLPAKKNPEECMKCHNPSGIVQIACTECHSSGFNSQSAGINTEMANVHRGEFRVSHPIAARANQRLCETCHETTFCTDCHKAFNPEVLASVSHRRGWSDKSVGNALHKQFNVYQCDSCHPGSTVPETQWSSAHAREARRNLATCQTCHESGDVCLTCHSARTGLKVNPHPSNWGNGKSDALLKASSGKTCKKCH